MSATIEWVGHACFRIRSGDSAVLVLDPYTPAELGVPDVAVDGDVVIVSSLDDSGHANVDLVRGDPVVVDALAVATGRASAPDEIPLVAAATHESVDHPDGPDPNAAYALRIGGLWILHMGDAGQALDDDALATFAGRCDVLLALAGGGLTLSLEELDATIEALAPRWIVPMHYGLPAIAVPMLPVEDFLARRTGDPVLLARSSTIEIPDAPLVDGCPVVVVLEPSGF
jgi:L-ascorbate metabolism protein UlaG (beta-lactamase superfamily)